MLGACLAFSGVWVNAELKNSSSKSSENVSKEVEFSTGVHVQKFFRNASTSAISFPVSGGLVSEADPNCGECIEGYPAPVFPSSSGFDFSVKKSTSPGTHQDR